MEKKIEKDKEVDQEVDQEIDQEVDQEIDREVDQKVHREVHQKVHHEAHQGNHIEATLESHSENPINGQKGSEPVGITVHRVDCEIKRELDSLHDEDGLGDQGRLKDWFIHFLFENQDKDLFQKDFEKRFSVGRSTVTGILQSLEKQGYVSRVSTNQDARLKKVILTQKGLDYQMKRFEDLHQFELDLRDGISEEDFASFYRVCNQVLENIAKRRGERKHG